MRINCLDAADVEHDENPNVVHAWESTGLDVVRDRLCSTRRCVWCGKEQAKAYGGRGYWHWRAA